MAVPWRYMAVYRTQAVEEKADVGAVAEEAAVAAQDC